ncbi:hypothetical protein KKH23_06290, partial [Patescibacteria group bacterium]|nr:hypothetical protein [Patescibacteria group bacterium]
MAIDVGPSCTERSGDSWPNNYTVAAKSNPANATGTIDYVCMWWNSTTSGVEVASFTDEGSDVLSTNGTASLPNRATEGEQEYDAPGDFTAFNITLDDYIGGVWTGGSLGRESGTPAVYYKSGDYIPCDSESFGSVNYVLSIYATGTEGGGESSSSSSSESISSSSSSESISSSSSSESISSSSSSESISSSSSSESISSSSSSESTSIS